MVSLLLQIAGSGKRSRLIAKVINTTVITNTNDTKNLWRDTSFDLPVEDFRLVSSEIMSSPTSISENGRSSSVTLPPLDRRHNSVTSLKALAPSKIMVVNGEEESTIISSNRLPLKESVGHTLSEVFVGALLRCVVSSVLYSLL